MNTIQIVIADDHTVLRSGLKLMINSQADMEVVGEATDGNEAVEVCQTLRPDLLLLDISMPGMDGIRVLEELRKKNVTTIVLVLTMYNDRAYLKRVMRAGASGYILKQAADVELLSAIREVCAGEMYIDRSLTRAVVEELISPSGEDDKTQISRPDTLSDREKEVLRLVALGYSNKQIADVLVISAKTVESHKAHIKEKLNVKGRAELVRFAMENGLLPTE